MIPVSWFPHEDRFMKRYGMVIRLKEGCESEYRKFHAHVWPEVLDRIRESHIRNYSIYLKENLLFSYFEYHGTDFRRDMEKMAADPDTQRWWSIMGPMQVPLESRAEGEWWADMAEVFHVD